MTAPGPNDLTTVAAVAAYLGQPGTQDADLLQTLVIAASAFIATWTGCSFVQGQYSELRDGNGRDIMALANQPVTAIATLTIDGAAILPSPGWPQPGYAFDVSCLYLFGQCFPPGRRNVAIAYTAGYATVPADLGQACAELVAYRYRLRDHTGIVSEGGLQQTTAYSQSDMPASVKSALAPYRRVFAV